ncbi:MAG TPA: chorismate lyase [Gammaproteobacteria bacterium]|nr:chorismate lyase [Gammaproteobacteria bacterium]
MKATAASIPFHSWRSLPSWSADARPAALWPYLSEAGSLTERLKAKAGAAFHVQVLQVQAAPLLPQDAALLYARTGEPAYLRQVYLCGEQPLVYARSVAVGEGARWLKGLGDNPLGARVFAERDARRGPIEVACLMPGEPLHTAAVAGLPRVPQELWARRSLLTVRAAAILIYECFLPELGR